MSYDRLCNEAKGHGRHYWCGPCYAKHEAKASSSAGDTTTSESITVAQEPGSVLKNSSANQRAIASSSHQQSFTADSQATTNARNYSLMSSALAAALVALPTSVAIASNYPATAGAMPVALGSPENLNVFLSGLVTAVLLELCHQCLNKQSQLRLQMKPQLLQHLIIMQNHWPNRQLLLKHNCSISGCII